MFSPAAKAYEMQETASIGVRRSFLSEASLWQPKVIVPSAWIQHAPFGFWIVNALRPRVLVELGTHHGFSYLVFLQAIQKIDYRCQCFAVDTWKGEEHSGVYGPEVLAQLRNNHDDQYGNFSELLQSTFDDAAPRFAASSIDLLHIDGRHFFEDVKHDFEMWKPRMSDRGVILFHDTGVSTKQFGVYRLWEELSERYPSFEFKHAHGLGILGVGSEIPSPVVEFLSLTKDDPDALLTRELYQSLGERISAEGEQRSASSVLQHQNELLARTKEELSSTNAQYADALVEFEKTRAELTETRAVLAKTRAELVATSAELARTTAEVANVNSRIAELEVRERALYEEAARCRNDGLAVREALFRSEADNKRYVAKATEIENYLSTSLERLDALARQSEQLTESVADSSVQLEQTKEQLTTVRVELEAVLSSRSWRVTRPGRRIFEVARMMSPDMPMRKLKRAFRDWRSRRQLISSGLFDKKWYLEQNADVADAAVDPVRHYLAFGAAEGRNPHPLFDTRWYLATNADVAAAGGNPLSHFLAWGWHEGRDPNPFFDTDWYLTRYKDVANAQINPLRHYIERGASEGREPNPSFDSKIYRQRHPTVDAEKINPLVHYILVGRSEESQSTVQSTAVEPAASIVKVFELSRQHFAGLRRLRVYMVPRMPPRVTMITDSINSGYLFGGVATAMIFSALLARQFGIRLRIITRHERPLEDNFAHILGSSGISWCGNVDFLYSSLSEDAPHVDIGPAEIFVTTSWWTTFAVSHTVAPERLVYLMQEDERMFYPFGDERLLCEETLKSRALTFVINSQMLYEHLSASGMNFLRDNGIWFEPSFPIAHFHMNQESMPIRRSNFLFYARPNNLRNLFYRGIEAIDRAIERNILSPEVWDIHLVGKDLYRMSFHRGVEPALHQNLEWADYSTLIRETDLGLSLMYSPHPSYPPLDLAASGAVAVTNKYGGKKTLAAYSKNIICVDSDIDSLVEGIKCGVELVGNRDARLANYHSSGLQRDWYTSLARALEFVARRVAACS
jgi:hypothetical protein